MSVPAALARVRDCPFVVDALRAADALSQAAASDRGAQAVAALTVAACDPGDQLTAIAAVHALGRVFDDSADGLLSELLSHEHAFLREHAAWGLGARLPRLDAIGRLVAVVAAGGFPGMVAQRTLERWSAAAADHVALALEGALAAHHDPAARARLVETLGLVPGSVAARAVRHRAADLTEDAEVRLAAVAALGDRAGDAAAADLVRALARADDALAAVARLAAVDLGLTAVPTATADRRGLTIAQLFLHADLDHALTSAGTGDNGGVATLLVRLGDAFAADSTIARVLTLSRGTPEAAADVLGRSDDGHVLAPVPLPHPPVSAPEAWPARVAATRGIRRALLALGPVDVLHLRMADVGSLAAQAVAQHLGIPVVFTLAPDPHAVLHALDMTGALDRSNFGTADEQEHYWFRARLVQRLAADAEGVVLFPRQELRHELQELLGIDVTSEPQRYTVVPEGIDLAVTEAARQDVAQRAAVAALHDLEELVKGLSPERHGLPLVISVGRLHRVKGMATVVEAWATDPGLRDRCNLVIVGGDLDRPSPDEHSQLQRIAAVLASSPGAATGLVLAGHRPNDVVARWLAAAHAGLGPTIGPGGAYACGSLKEEFGLAILEAMAAGLPVVAPAGGGPATYVEDGVTGVLVDTRSAKAVSVAMGAALDLAHAPGRVQRAARLVRDQFTVQAMAQTLTQVYATVTTGVPLSRS